MREADDNLTPERDPAGQHLDRDSLLARVQLLEGVVRDLPGAVAYIDTALVFQGVNGIFARLFHRAPEDFERQAVFAMFPGTEAQVEGILRSVLETGKPFSATGFPITAREGDMAHETYWDFTIKVLPDPQGRTMGLLLLGFEVTSRVLLEKEVEGRNRALEQSEQKFKRLFETAPVGIALCDLEGRLVETNLAYQTLLGRTAEELAQLTIFDVTHPDDRPVSTQLFNELREGLRETYHLEKRFRRKDGAEIWAYLIATLVRDARGNPQFTIGMVDITSRMLEEEALRLSWEKYRRLVELSPEAIAVHDGQHLLYVNPAMMFLLGARQAEELVGKPVISFVHPDHREAVRARIEGAKEDKVVNPVLEETWLRVDGASVEVEVANADIDFGGQPAVQVIARDIAWRRQAEALRLEVAKQAELNKLKADLVSAVSHELRTPLTSIMGYAEFLEDEVAGPLESGQLSFVHQIQEGTRRLQRLVDDLLDFARLEAGTFRLAPSIQDLTHKTHEIVDSLRPQAQDKGIRLQVDVPEAPLMVRMDGGRIGQVLLNLVGNAIKFTPPGGQVAVRVVPSAVDVRVEVSDTGIGIAPELHARLFEKFYQVDGTLTREKGGAGLGLSIAQALVTAHGGQIGVTSTPGQGSTFWFTLPFQTHVQAIAHDAPS